MELTLDLQDVPAELRPAVDILTDRHREIVALLDAGRVSDAWAQPRLRSINVLLAVCRKPVLALAVRDVSGSWSVVRWGR